MAKHSIIQPARLDWQDSTPRSVRHDDSYYMPGRGRAESWTVFIEANQLPQRFGQLRADHRFVIGETGFGTGLNLLLAARCFLDQAPATCHLDLFSAELYPIKLTDLQRTRPAEPELQDLFQRLLAGYAPPVHGHHAIWLHPRVRLVLMLDDATRCWAQRPARVDAWFLDGFAPARNPDMWDQALFDALACCSRPGATLGTFTAAAVVREGLKRSGFTVERLAGFDRKRHRLIGRWPGAFQAQAIRRGQALVAGAGLAGCSSARALAERGWQVTVVDPAGVASGASGNLAGVVHATVSAHMTAQNRFYQLALIHALRRFHGLCFPAEADDGALNDVLQIAAHGRMADKIEQALAAGTWPAELIASRGPGQILLRGAGYLRPERWCRHLLDHPAIALIRDRVQGFAAANGVSVALQSAGPQPVDALVLCMAEAVHQLPGLDWLPLKLIRGQVSYVKATTASAAWRQAICHAGYLTPALDGLHCVGATYDLKRPTAEIDPADDQANLDQLREQLPEHWQDLGGEAIEIVDRRAAVRCQTPDFLPLAGPLADPTELPHRLVPGVYLNLAHGSRGLTHTPLCADLIADLASGLSPSLDTELIDALAPERFILRRRRREPGWNPGPAPWNAA